MTPRSIAAINKLPETEKTAIYQRFVPRVLLERFRIGPDLRDEKGRGLLRLRCAPGTTDLVLELRHIFDAPDPLLYAHLTDTVNGQIHVLLYVVNDPHSPRFDVDRLPDGTPTQFGVFRRNIPAEVAAMAAGLAPGQVRRGLGILRKSIEAFEAFVHSLGHGMFFVEPLYYHNAVIFERCGFSYQQGLRLMKAIHGGLQSQGELFRKLDASSPFRRPGMAGSIRGRSWAIHDGLLGEPYSNVTMYKQLGQHAGVDTFPGGTW
jgi:hypothetical protein